MKISPEIIKACKTVNAERFLAERYGVLMKKEGVYYRLAQDVSVTFFPPEKNRDGNWRWKEFSSTKGGSGDIIDFLTNYLHVRFADAVTNIASYMGLTDRLPDARRDTTESNLFLTQKPERSDVPKVETKALVLPARNFGRGSDSRVVAYLIGRGIEKDIIYDCFKRKILYQDKEHGNCVFVGMDRFGTPRSAALRGTLTKPGIPAFKGNVPGGDGHFSFCIVSANPHADSLCVTESPIDAMSLASLMKLQGQDWRKTHILSLHGVNKSPLDQFLLDYPRVKNIAFYLDNDKAGIEAVRYFIPKYQRDYNAIAYQVQGGKDLNDKLQAMKNIHPPKSKAKGEKESPER